MTNREIGELLALESERQELSAHLRKALKKASRAALQWPCEAFCLFNQGRSLQELPRVGPVLARTLMGWFESPPERREADLLRRDFLTMSEAYHILEGLDESWKPRGDLQLHTVWSDGTAEIEEMADAASSLGYEYMAVTDHTKGLKIANGLDEERLTQQAEEIRFLNGKQDRIRILTSCEVNLSPSGEVDMDPEALARLDLVLGCFHSKLRLKEDQTERYLAALRNPCINTLGHPRGRVYNYRLGLRADWEAVFEEARRLDKAVEIDCIPDRQDLDVATLEIARRCGVRISLGTDAHGCAGLQAMALGVAAAWKAGIERERVVNFMGADELVEWAHSVRSI